MKVYYSIHSEVQSLHTRLCTFHINNNSHRNCFYLALNILLIASSREMYLAIYMLYPRLLQVHYSTVIYSKGGTLLEK